MSSSATPVPIREARSVRFSRNSPPASRATPTPATMLLMNTIMLAVSACDESTTPTQPEERASQAAAAAVSYLAQDMDNPFMGEGGAASSINTAGQVVGSAFGPDDTWRAWIWRSGSTTLLGNLGGSWRYNARSSPQYAPNATACGTSVMPK